MKKLRSIFAFIFLNILVTLSGFYFAPDIHERGGCWLHRKVSRPFADTLLRLHNFKKLAWERKQENLALYKEKLLLKKQINHLSKELVAAEKFLRPETSLRRSPQSLVFQNYKAANEGLKQARNEKDFEKMKKRELVKITAGEKLKFDPKHVKPENEYCLPQTRRCLSDLSHDFYEKFGKPIILTSLFRTEVYQRKLGRTNGNIAKDEDPAHPTGAAFDIKKRNLSEKELRFVRSWLIKREALEMLDATENHFQPNFHVMVFRNYQRIRE